MLEAAWWGLFGGLALVAGSLVGLYGRVSTRGLGRVMAGGAGGRSGMGHFAPVVAKSGSDSVTLENDVRQTAGQVRAQIGDLNPNWYMRMFGPVKRHLFSANEDQTFWGEAKKNESADYGDRPLVGRLGSA